jgi:peptide/nickel transport system substrate-binding protein
MCPNAPDAVVEKRRSAILQPLTSTAVAVAGALALLVPTAAARPDANAGRSAAPKTPFVVNYALPPASLDPNEASGLADAGFISNMYVTLLKYGTKRGANGFPEDDLTKIEPYLATRWRQQDGGRTWVFTLRRGAVFADGSPMDANAVKYSFDRINKRVSIGSVFLNANNPVGFVTSVEAPNPTTVIVRLKSPSKNVDYADMHTYANLSIVNPRVVEANGGIDPRRPNVWMASHAAGGGPYVLQEYDPNRRAVLVANPRFFGPKPREPRVIVNFVKSDPTLLFQATARRADVTVGLTLQSTASLRGNSCCQVVANSFQTMVLLALPNAHPPFNNKLFRQALSYAVPYAGLIRTVAYGYAKSYYGPYPPAFSNYNAKIAKPRQYDVARARRLLEQSGVRTPVSIDLIVREGLNDDAQIAVAVQASWRQLGVNVNIKTLTAAQYASARYTTSDRTYALIEQRSLVFGDPAWTLTSEVPCSSIVNTSDYCSPTLEALLDRILDTPRNRRQPLWDQFARVWVADAPRIPIYSPQYVVALKRGVRYYHFGSTPLALWKWGR